MKNVLVIAYYFPPMGGGGVQRTSKFVKYLPEFGYQPIVLTIKPNLVRYAKDYSLIRDIPPSVRVHRTGVVDVNLVYRILEKLRLDGLSKWINSNIMLNEHHRSWVRFAREELDLIVMKHKIDLIFITGGPFSPFALGPYARRKYGIPYVLDYRDEWTTNPLFLKNNPQPKVRKKLEAFETEILENASGVVFMLEDMAMNYQRRFPFLARKKIGIVENGYDEDDFRHFKPVPGNPEAMDLLFSGLCYEGLTDPALLFSVIQELIDDGSIPGDRIRVLVYGRNSEIFLRSVFNSDKEKGRFLHVLPYQPHDQLLKFLSRADVLFLIVNPGPNTDAVATGKIFEYIRTGVPVLGIVPENGVAARIIRETKAGFVADSASREQIRGILLECYRRWESRTLVIDPDWAKIRRFDRRNLTKMLASHFESALKAE